MAQSVLERFKQHPQDTGSVETQVVRLTEEINKITKHRQENPKDFSAQRGLIKLVGQRKRFLEYVRGKNEDLYRSLIKELNLRK